MQAASLIGHGVWSRNHDSGGHQHHRRQHHRPPRRLALSCSRRRRVTATITDNNGTVVRTIDIGELKAGVHTFTWDGSLTDGTKAPNGSYQVAISASNGTTQLVAQPLQFALVQGVIKGSDGNKLDLGTSGTTTLDEVRQII
ncbi:MAG: FlgD immunoglobulin-like domain containing protein [Enterobacter hormaechei]